MGRVSKQSKLLRTLVWIAVIYLLVTVCIALLLTRFIFQPEKLPYGYDFSFPQHFEELNIAANDGAQLNALYFTVLHPKGAILYFHGNKGSLKRWGAIAGNLTKYGYNVMVMDYRGYGKSTGKRSEAKMQGDAMLCYQTLQKYFKEDSIIVYGRSLGTHFATLVASENKPRQLILETPFTSLVDVAKCWLPVFPVKQLLRFSFDNIPLVKKVNCPLTIIHGTADGVVPYRLGKKLFESANKNKTLVTVPGGSHNDLVNYREYNAAIEKILNAEF